MRCRRWVGPEDVDPQEIGDCRDAQLSEVARGADSGAQKDRGAAVGPCGEDYLPGGVDVPGRADDSGRGCAVEEHLVDYDLADDGEIWPATYLGGQIGDRRTLPHAVDDIDRASADTFGIDSVEVVDVLVAVSN